jgi:hypothetical protein
MAISQTEIADTAKSERSAAFSMRDTVAEESSLLVPSMVQSQTWVSRRIGPAAAGSLGVGIPIDVQGSHQITVNRDGSGERTEKGLALVLEWDELGDGLTVLRDDDFFAGMMNAIDQSQARVLEGRNGHFLGAPPMCGVLTG